MRTLQHCQFIKIENCTAERYHLIQLTKKYQHNMDASLVSNINTIQFCFVCNGINYILLQETALFVKLTINSGV